MIFGDDRPDWSVDGRDWPNRAMSRFVSTGDMTWHVQTGGTGPVLLLLHGTGAATHSWRDLIPLLASRFTVVAPDLPGHGFTSQPPSGGASLPGMAHHVERLLAKLQLTPDLAVGHSAGAAVLLAMAMKSGFSPRLIVAVNGAIQPMAGNRIFSPLAKLLFLNPFAPKLFAWRARSAGATENLLKGTGSTIDARGVALYERLFRRRSHIAGTLAMMANWDLDWLSRSLDRVSVPVALVTAAGDRAVPPSDALRTRRSLRNARIEALPAGGHLVHEERPAEMADLILGLWETQPALSI